MEYKGKVMKVFGCKNQENYGGGLILVAANSKEEAFIIASEDKDKSWLFYVDGCGLLTSDVYPCHAWVEFEHLSTDLTEPQVIIEDHYLE